MKTQFLKVSQQRISNITFIVSYSLVLHFQWMRWNESIYGSVLFCGIVRVPDRSCLPLSKEGDLYYNVLSAMKVMSRNRSLSASTMSVQFSIETTQTMIHYSRFDGWLMKLYWTGKRCTMSLRSYHSIRLWFHVRDELRLDSIYQWNR